MSLSRMRLSLVDLDRQLRMGITIAFGTETQ